MEREKFINKRVREHYEEACSLGFEVVGVWLQGSQNYNLDIYRDDYTSDIDTKCIVLPSLEDIVSGKAPYSSTHVCANNEHIDIKDIRVMFDMFEKQNNAYIEILFTKYCVINPKYQKLVDELISKNEEIARYNTNQALRCFSGTSMEKYKALEHPYPSLIDKIEKFGYDPKQLHHIIRINDMMKKYVADKSYYECLLPEKPTELIEIKLGKYNLDEARRLAKEYDDSNKKIKNENTLETEPVKNETEEFLTLLKIKFIKQHLEEEILDKNNSL